MDIIGWIVGLIILIGLFDEGGFVFWVIALVLYLVVDTNDETTKQDPEISEVQTTLVEGLSDTSGGNDPPQENATGGGAGVYLPGINAQNESNTKRQKVGVPSSGAIQTKLEIMLECEKNRKFVFTHDGVEYDIGCGSAFKRNVQN